MYSLSSKQYANGNARKILIMKASDLIIIAGVAGLSLVTYFVIKGKKSASHTPPPPPPPEKPDCSAYGKVNCQVLDDLGHTKEWCCCPDGQVLCGQGKGDTPVGGPMPAIDTKCYDPNVDYVMDPCR